VFVTIQSWHLNAEKGRRSSHQVSDLEANLQVLAYPLDLSVSDRLRYYDIVTRADVAISVLELIAVQHIWKIESTGVLIPNNITEAPDLSARTAYQNTRLTQIYGDCVEEIVYSLIVSEDEMNQVTQ
jgi:hypothetical protein